MNKPHKHAELIKKWADGAKIEFFNGENWFYDRYPSWHDDYQYRIKPEPKPEFESTMNFEAVGVFLNDGVPWLDSNKKNLPVGTIIYILNKSDVI